MLLFFFNYSTILASRGQVIFRLLNSFRLKKAFAFILAMLPLCVAVQQAGAQKLTDTSKAVSDSRLKNQVITSVSGKIVDAGSGKPLYLINVSFNSNKGTRTDKEGKFTLSGQGSFDHVTFSYLGYQPVTKLIKPGQSNQLLIRLHSSQTQLNEVSVISGKRKRYRNKGNPAVELIQQVINHKDENRMESSGYLQYDQYERIGLSLFNLSSRLLNSHFFSQYKFMLDTTSNINGKTQTSLPVFFSEKFYQNYFRRDPEKSIKILQAEKGANVIKFVDTVGLNIYLNRLYGNTIDIYTNNIFIINNQFLSPIADHAPDFYKFFITDTIQSGKEKLIELSFTPRNKGDLLFEGKLLVTLDGHYAVASCELNVNKQININFMRSLQVVLDFKQHTGGRYYVEKSDVKADFGILKDKGMAVFGERTVNYSNYKLNSPMPEAFYQGKSQQTAPDAQKLDTGYWARHRTDTLTDQQAQVYNRITKLENIASFKKATWIASTLTGGYADLGPVQIGPIGSFLAFDNQEGVRLGLGGRTTPKFNNSIYFDGYEAIGTKDKKIKYDINTYISLNKTPPYRFANDYFKVSYLYDVNLPGHTYSINNSQAALSSFHTGKTDYWIYSRIFTVAYVKDFENHFSYNLALLNWNQKAAGTLVFQLNDQNKTIVQGLISSEVDLGLRYAPHEQIIQGTQDRHTIHSKYPIFNVHINHGFTGWLNGSYNYTAISANIYKRFYLSQLGYTDITLLGNLLTGKVPFPLLNISPANQSFAYDPNAYNRMDYLEFVSDHYVGMNLTHNFTGFFLNKIPLIEHLKWREYLSFKVLYGGLRNENNPLYSKNLYVFPTSSTGGNNTYALGNTPYTEAGAGIGNILKVLRVDVIRRFNYLNHPGISPYGIKFTLSPDL